jgi:hypothetical protein
VNHFFAALGKAALCGLFLWVAACDAFKSDGYTWSKIGPPAEAYVWKQVDYCAMEGTESAPCVKALNNLCPQADEKGRTVFVPLLWGCAQYSFTGGLCVVWSRYSVPDAKALVTNGRSHFEHEVGPLLANGRIDGSKGYGHGAGYVHKESHMRGV